MTATPENKQTIQAPPTLAVRADDPFVGAVADLIDARGLLDGATGVLVGVSGGADSVALLAALTVILRTSPCETKLYVAHLDHGSRDESADDAEFTARLAKAWSLRCVCRRVDVVAEAARRGESFEQAARSIRYEFLTETAGELGCTHIATAHHGDDQAETVLHRILRGCGIEGLRGIPLRRPASGDGNAPMIIRPLLERSRDQIEGFLRRWAIPWRTDATNAVTDHTRNRLRHELLPLLREHYNPAVDKALLRLARAAERAASLLDGISNDLFDRVVASKQADRVELDLPAFEALDEAAAAAVIRRALADLGPGDGDLGMEHIDAIVRAPRGGGIKLPGGLSAHRRRDRLVIARAAVRAVDPGALPVAMPGETPLPDGTTLTIALSTIDGDAQAKRPAHAKKPRGPRERRYAERIDADAVRGSLTIRRRRPGDRFVPLGAPGERKLKDFYNDEALDIPQREATWLLCDESGILWVAPLRIAERARITPATRRIAEITIRDSETTA